MSLSQWGIWFLAAGSIGVFLSSYPYLATAIRYRQRDNGLAYIILLMGVGVWNALFVAQFLDPEPLIKGFFYVLSLVGATIAGLGWFLFASTASSTPRIPHIKVVYAFIGTVIGVTLAVIITSFSHSLYWTISMDPGSTIFVDITPGIGYWIHSAFLVGLFFAGSLLFAIAWREQTDVEYTLPYLVAGIATATAIIVSTVFFPGGATIAPIVAGSLTTIGWIQAREKLYLPRVRSIFPISHFLRE